jgi:hypothetical protein
MSSSDWVALGGLLLSCLAFAVSFVAYKLQQKTAKSDNEKELADQIAAVQTHLAEPNFTAQAGYVTAATARAVSQEAIAKASSTNAALQMLVLRVGNLIESTGVTPDWYQNLVLASAAVRIGDQVMASPYVTAAVRLARQPEDRGWNAETAAAAQMLSLQVRANFFYNRGHPEDVTAAREDYERARELVLNVRPQQGPFMTAGRLAELYVRQTEFELDLGYDDRAVDLMAKACHEWQEARVPAVQQAIGNLIWSFVAAQSRVAASTLLTGEFVEAWNRFQRNVPDPGSGAPAPGTPGPGGDISDLLPIRVVRPEGEVSPAPGTLS